VRATIKRQQPALKRRRNRPVSGLSGAG